MCNDGIITERQRRREQTPGPRDVTQVYSLNIFMRYPFKRLSVIKISRISLNNSFLTFIHFISGLAVQNLLFNLANIMELHTWTCSMELTLHLDLDCGNYFVPKHRAR